MTMLAKSFTSAACLMLLFGCASQRDDEVLRLISQSAAQTDSVLINFEQRERLEEALAGYREIDAGLSRLELKPDHPHYRKKQSVHAQCLLRLGNILRQLDKSAEALAVGKRELEAARAAGDTITLARTLISNGASLIVNKEKERGLGLLEEARRLFEQDTSFDFRQGLGWYWILQADLAEAGFTSTKPEARVAFADSALHLLLPLKNWPGVARAYAARVQAHKLLGNNVAALEDSSQQANYQALVGKDE